ncbi:MAG TPA: LysM peptidoglycan-binding domain-containing protein [Ilumatobacteraceae bacterium]|nr:LysM peptidoglycan-binding domain-containing protein [Ilumatobacteraceae bacterium]
MARRSHDDYSNSSEDRSRDLTAQFWGSAPSWNTTGSFRRVRRNGDRTGPVARTRKHGDRTGQIPIASAAPIEEPLIDPYDFGFDDVGYGPDPGIAARRIDARSRASVQAHADGPPEFVELIELDERPAGAHGDPVSTLADRLGFGAVDPLLLRLGVIVMIGVLLVPVAMGLRPSSNRGSVRTEAAAPATDLAGSGATPVVQDAPPPVVGNAADSAALQPTESQSSAEPAVAAAPSTEPIGIAVAPAEQTETAVSTGAADESTDEAELDVAETVQATSTTAQAVTEAADADEPANRVAPVCALSYTVAAGDYWIRIADAANTTLAKLLQANLATVATPLYPGDDICLPEGATLPSVSTTTTAPPATAPAPTTTAPTTTAPATTAPVVTAPPAPAAIEAIIREIWPDDLEARALEIAWRESGYRANAQNWCCYGLFQIHWNAHRSWLDDFGVTTATQLFDARTNARVAYALYQRSGGWGPWEP